MAPQDVNKPPSPPGPMADPKASSGSGLDPPSSAPQGAASTSGFGPSTSAGFVSTLPTVSLPKGGGAMRGIDEKLEINPSSGSCALNIPINLSKARSAAATPSLALSYNSGAGNGPFGLGWGISVPAITRKTDKGVPRYRDVNNSQEDDIFIFAGVEDLVPRLLQTDNSSAWTVDEVVRDGYVVRRYVPRIEGGFFQIERFTKTGDIHDVFWRVRTGDNQEQIFGIDNESRIHDGDGRIYSWLLRQTSDRYGNAVEYSYQAEDSVDVDVNGELCEKNRTEGIRARNRYLKSIKYGNLAPRRPEAITAAAGAATQATSSHPFTFSAIATSDTANAWMFEAVFDYGERVISDPGAKAGPWTCRKDAFSTYRAGFEIRTYRLCRRILMFHHFPNELGGGSTGCLVGSTCFEYMESPVASLLTNVSSFGHTLEVDGCYSSVPRPVLSLSYSEPPQLEELVVRDADTPFDLHGNQYQWVDLNSDGLQGVLCEQGSGWFYRRNLSANNIVDSSAAPRFGPLELVNSWPASGPKSSGTRLADLEGTGEIGLIVGDLNMGVHGYYERTTADGWTNFHPFSSWPNIDLSQPNVQFVDLTGDGKADILVTEDEAFSWYRSLGKDGYDQACRTFHDEEHGPKLVFEDESQAIYLADFSGDGHHDLVRVRNGDICYWPSLGYGQFGEKVTMGNAPWFEDVDLFSRDRLRLSDIYGSGTTDLIYLPGNGGADIYMNLAGNGWSSKSRLQWFPQTNMISFVSTVDLLGNGCACLVWTSSLATSGQSMRYIDFTQGRKPFLLEGYTNDMGLETKVTYVPSTRFYLDTEQDGNPWSTRLPFPVQCVAKTEVFDHVSKSYSSTRYAYHNGFYDRAEREFRGFGMVEQWDTAKGSNSVSFPTATNMDDGYLVPATRKRVWFHTGANISPLGRPLHNLTADYYKLPLLSESVLPQNTAGEDYTTAASRSLKGKVIREEFYAVLDPTANDSSPIAPFHVSEKNYTITGIQPGSPAQYAVCLVTERESITVTREREPDNPRIDHKIDLEHDRYGNVLKSILIAYGRRVLGSESIEVASIQAQTLLLYSEHWYTNHIDSANTHVIPQLWKTREYQVTGIRPVAGLGMFSVTQFGEIGFIEAQEIPYEGTVTTSLIQKRLVRGSDAYYRKDDLTGILNDGVIESLMLPGISYNLALTPGLVEAVYQGKRVSPIVSIFDLLLTGGYVFRHNNWWIPSGRQGFGPLSDSVVDLVAARANFFTHKVFTDQFQNTTVLKYDANNLLPVELTDPLGNVIIASNNYVHLQPNCITDMNGNQTEVVQNTLGEVVGTAIRGRDTGDSLEDFSLVVSDLEKSFLANPMGDAAGALLGNASTRTLIVYKCGPKTTAPAFRATISREMHNNGRASPDSPRSKLLVSFTYYDGLGREIQVKKQAGDGHRTQWLGSGWTVWNNKGLAVTQYEPFFDTTHEFVDEARHGTSEVTTFYDHLARPVCTFSPDGTWTKVIHDSWKTTTYDASDVLKIDPRSDPNAGHFYRAWKGKNAVLNTWYSTRTSLATTVPALERVAAQRSEAHDNTPTVSHLDNLGRQVVLVLANGAETFHSTRQDWDIAGNVLSVTDAQGRRILRTDFDMCGHALHRSTMDFGQEWIINDSAGQPLLRWQDDDIRIRTKYDALRRPIARYHASLEELGPVPETMFEKFLYGEPGPEVTAENAVLHNSRGRVYRQYDQSGVVTTKYDFKGNIVEAERQFVQEFKSVIDWSTDHSPQLEIEKFTNTTSFDALSRPTEVSIEGFRTKNTYNDLSLLSSVDTLAPPPTPTIDGHLPSSTPLWVSVITSIEYDALDRKVSITYGNRAMKQYTYNPLDRRATCVRNWTVCKNDIRQDLRYTYDPRGNITHIEDKVQPDIIQGVRVSASKDFVYDPVNRLIESSGRKDLGREGASRASGNALGRYKEKYSYDSTGNFTSIQYSTDNDKHPGSTKKYFYDDPIPQQPGKFTNRLSRMKVGRTTDRFSYDAHGNVVSMVGLFVMEWNFLNQLRQTSTQAISNTSNRIPQMTYYIYGADGNRVRKVTERQAASGSTPARLYETLYLGGLEIFRKYQGDGTLLLQRKTASIGNETPIRRVQTERWGTSGAVQETPLLIYQLPDHLGSATLELDNVGNLLSYEEYSSFGETTYQAPINSLQAPKRYRFSGKENDQETGLYYFGARYYSPPLGRWISPDPIGIGDGPNVYCYVRCNPVSFVDPDGKVGEGWGPPGTEDHTRWLERLPIVQATPESINETGSYNQVYENMKYHERELKTHDKFPVKWELPPATTPWDGPYDRWGVPNAKRHVMQNMAKLTPDELVDRMRHVFEVVTSRYFYDSTNNWRVEDESHRKQRWTWLNLFAELTHQFDNHPAIRASVHWPQLDAGWGHVLGVIGGTVAQMEARVHGRRYGEAEDRHYNRAYDMPSPDDD